MLGSLDRSQHYSMDCDKRTSCQEVWIGSPGALDGVIGQKIEGANEVFRNGEDR